MFIRHTLLIFIWLAATISTNGQRAVLHCGALIDDVSGSLLGPHSMVVEGSVIVAVEGDFPDGETDDTVIDLNDMTVMPGLMEARQSATFETARLLQIEDQLGSLEVGKLADIMGVRGKPIEDISILQNVQFVMKDGVIYKNGL